MASDRMHSIRGFVLPKHKHDKQALEPLIRLGYPGVEPVLPDLLTWLQDINWPIAQELIPFLKTIGLPLAPHIRPILKTDDGIWKYWVLSTLVEESSELATVLKEDMLQILEHPTEDDALEELPELIQKILERHHLR